MSAEMSEREYLTPKQTASRAGWITEPGLRRLLFDREKNGLNKAVVRISPKKLLIDWVAFLDWVASHKEQS